MGNEDNTLVKTFNGIEVEPCDNLPNQNIIIPLNLTSTQKAHVNALLQQLPSMLATGTLANAYVLNLPSGVSSSQLMRYADGGIGTPYYGEHGVAGHASLQSLQAQAAIMGAFTAMSIASGQYFLSKINNNLTAINQKADKILEFLYGDKKAELMAEVSFVNFAYQNYNSIMLCENQRTATIISLQESRKVAMKDIEFYMSDLDLLVKAKDNSDLESFVSKAFQIKDCLQLAIQLYGMSNILEVYYAQNTDSDYLHYVEKDILAYIDKCEKRMLSSFSAIQMWVGAFKGNPLKKIDKSGYEKRISEVVDLLGNGEELIKRKPLQTVLQSFQSESVYYLNKEGEVYIATA